MQLILKVIAAHFDSVAGAIGVTGKAKAIHHEGHEGPRSKANQVIPSCTIVSFVVKEISPVPDFPFRRTHV
jgi:hypothetical protein